MIEGLILAGELAVFGLLLWNVRRLNDTQPGSSLGVFDMTDPEEVKEETIKRKAPHA